jgi:hypothetical protein
MASDLQKTWEERITRAKKVREKWQSEFRTQMGRDYFEGRQNPGYPEDEWITVNKIYSHLQAQLPLLYSMDPYFYVKLKKSYVVDAAQIAAMEAKGRTRQGMLNYLKSELHLKEKARLGIQDAHFEFGVLKVRRAADSKKHPHAGEPILSEDGKELKDPETGETQVYPDVLPVNERYELHRVNPCDILFDEDAGPLEDSWSWIAHHRCISRAEALEDSTFNKKAVRNARGKSRADPEKKEEKTGFVARIFSKLTEKDDEVFFDLHEIYDLKRREFLTFCEDADDLFVEPRTCPPGIDKHPFSFLRFTLRDNSPYPIPPVSPALDPQKEYSLARSRHMTHRKRFNRKYEVVSAKLADPATGMSKIEGGDDGTCIEVLALGAVAPIADAPLDQQSYTELALLNSDLTEVFGTPAQARGVADADSATEASILDKRLEVREGDRLSMVVDWIIDTARKLDMLVQKHIDRDEAVKITGPQGEFWQQIKESDYGDIEGEYEYSVNLGASQPRLPDIERSQWIAFMSQVVIPFPHILTAPTVMKRMAEMFHIEDEAALEEFRQMGLKIMAGAMPMPGGQGGGPSDNPIAAVMGAAMGPMGGNTNGGGAPTVTQ